ncbi:MAG: thiamine pyrophosphate-dependent enzyme [Pseudomonadota bacterium]
MDQHVTFPVDDEGRIRRRPLVAELMAHRGEALVITGLGSATYDVAAAGDHDNNFYFWGGMGLTAMTGLGLAVAQPQRRAVVITGDGDMMMGIGSLATIASAAPDNLAILVLDNERFGETGEQIGLSAGVTDMVQMAKGAGFQTAATFASEAEMRELPELLFSTPGPVFCVAKVAPGNDERVLPSTDGAYLTRRFRDAL